MRSVGFGALASSARTQLRSGFLYSAPAPRYTRLLRFLPPRRLAVAARKRATLLASRALLAIDFTNCVDGSRTIWLRSKLPC